jgi:hypothetical protein
MISYCIFNNLANILRHLRSPMPGKNYALPERFGEKSRIPRAILPEFKISSPARHTNDFRILGRAVPELEQDDVAAMKFQVVRTLTSVVEYIFVEQKMETLEGDSEQLGSFLLGQKFVFCGANHGIYLVEGLYLFRQSWRIR